MERRRKEREEKEAEEAHFLANAVHYHGTVFRKLVPEARKREVRSFNDIMVALIAVNLYAWAGLCILIAKSPSSQHTAG
jgi:hypothetical protein